MRKGTLRAWTAVHSWTSLACTAFLLMLCLTGLPLIFHDEIEGLLITEDWAPANADGPLLSLDEVLASALERRPGEVPLYMSFDTDRPVVNVTSGPAPDAPGSAMHFAPIDRTSGDLVPVPSGDGGVMDFLLQLHTDMFLGLPGKLFLGAMGLVFVAALVSGVVLYAPFMRRHEFGVMRRDRSPRLFWLDTHDLLGIVVLAWASVVGLTGVVNTLEEPINALWRERALADLTAPYEGRGVPAAVASIDAAVAEAVAAAPEQSPQFVAFPGTDYSTDHHLTVFLHGNTPLTERIITPVLVDATTGAVAGRREMPLTSKALSLSRPLHFGDYGGLPLKVIWAVLDLFTIVVLSSGLYLWVRKRRRAVPLRAEAMPA